LLVLKKCLKYFDHTKIGHSDIASMAAQKNVLLCGHMQALKSSSSIWQTTCCLEKKTRPLGEHCWLESLALE
jgi:hypothetical protein